MKKGIFVVFEGADGVGKSTVIRGAIPQLLKEFHAEHYVFFHWKPVSSELCVDRIPGDNPHAPRGKNPRNAFLSFCFLMYHLSGFWMGYFGKLRSYRKQGYLVVADRYVYDFFLDPPRFRLFLPTWMLRVAIKLVPQPDCVIALTATPERVIERKQELSMDEIQAYQQKLLSLPIGNLVSVNADGTPEEVIQETMNACMRKLNSTKG